jgi:hypothetical protein
MLAGFDFQVADFEFGGGRFQFSAGLNCQLLPECTSCGANPA